MHTIPLPLLRPLRPQKPRVRFCRRQFSPVEREGPYKLPRCLQERLTGVLTGFRNAEAAYRLAIFLARYWSAPGRLERCFPIDRRALTGHRDLELTESQVRGAIRTLEAIGFINRVLPEGGSRYRATETGLHRKPILFLFGSEFIEAFRAANGRSKARRGTRQVSSSTSSPKRNSPAPKVFLMGENMEGSLKAQSDSALEAAIGRLKEAIGIQRLKQVGA